MRSRRVVSRESGSLGCAQPRLRSGPLGRKIKEGLPSHEDEVLLLMLLIP